MITNLKVSLYGEREPRAELQVITKRGFVDGPIVVQIAISDEKVSTAIWLSAEEALALAGALEDAAAEAAG